MKKKNEMLAGIFGFILLTLLFAYIFFIPFFLSFLMEKGKNKMYGGILMILPLLLYKTLFQK